MELDLHGGIRQQLISLGFALRMTRESVPSELDCLRQELGHIMFGLAATSRRCGASPVGYIRRSYRLVGSARR
jgi:hypothetical protein